MPGAAAARASPVGRRSGERRYEDHGGEQGRPPSATASTPGVTPNAGTRHNMGCFRSATLNSKVLSVASAASPNRGETVRHARRRRSACRSTWAMLRVNQYRWALSSSGCRTGAAASMIARASPAHTCSLD